MNPSARIKGHICVTIHSFKWNYCEDSINPDEIRLKYLLLMDKGLEVFVSFTPFYLRYDKACIVYCESQTRLRSVCVISETISFIFKFLKFS
jgi:hypothetical protein